MYGIYGKMIGLSYHLDVIIISNKFMQTVIHNIFFIILNCMVFEQVQVNFYEIITVFQHFDIIVRNGI